MAELLRLAEGRVPEEGAQESPPLVSQVVDYLGAHYREELSLDALAERFFVSKYHLSHLFSRSVGTSVYRYVLLKRLQNARQLLLDGNRKMYAGTAIDRGEMEVLEQIFRAKRIPFVVMAGENERTSHTFTCKNMTSGEQQTCTLPELIEMLTT